MPLWIDDQGGEVLHVTHLMLTAQPDFLERIPVRATIYRSRLEAQHPIACILFPPPGSQLPQLALQIGDDGTLAPGQKGRHDKAHAFS